MISNSFNSSVFTYVQDRVLNMREKPSADAKIVSQAIFGEAIQIFEEAKGGWLAIETSDGYRGWSFSPSLCRLENRYTGNLCVARAAAHLYSKPDIEYGPVLTLPFGVELQEKGQIDDRWIKVCLHTKAEAFIQTGDVFAKGEICSKDAFFSIARQFIALPYTWGGRSSFGFDCSGLVQTLYRLVGIDLPRDSQQQAKDCRFFTFDPSDCEPGDLIFFGHFPHHVKHVGIALGDGTFLHATSRQNQPWIRISHLLEPHWSGSPGSFYPLRFGRRLLVRPTAFRMA